VQTRQLLLLLILLLAGCSSRQQPPRPSLPLVPIGAEPARPSAAPAPTVQAEVRLPGRLLFVRAGDLWLWQDSAGRQLTSRGDLTQPAWSPDGARIAAAQRGESYSEIVLLGPDGGSPLPVTRGGSRLPLHSYERIYDTTWSFYPSFSPDGREIAFAAQAAPPAGSPAAEYSLALYTAAPAAGGGKTQRFAPAEGNVGRPAYAPDGSAIVFAYAPGGQSAPHLLRLDRRSGAVAPPSGAPDQSYDPAFSGDGRWLAFAARDGGRTDIFAAPAGGGAPVRLTSLGTARAPAFAPDGSMLAFLAVAPGDRRFDLWVVDLSAGSGGLRAANPRQITRGLGLDADAGLAWGK
jgi:TolB protein